jgi:hypothetical protein
MLGSGFRKAVEKMSYPQPLPSTLATAKKLE